MEHDDSWMQEGSSQSQQSVEESSESSYQDSQSPIKPRANLPMSAPPPSLGTIAGAIAGAAPGYNALSGDSHQQGAQNGRRDVNGRWRSAFVR